MRLTTLLPNLSALLLSPEWDISALATLVEKRQDVKLQEAATALRHGDETTARSALATASEAYARKLTKESWLEKAQEFLGMRSYRQTEMSDKAVRCNLVLAALYCRGDNRAATGCFIKRARDAFDKYYCLRRAHYYRETHYSIDGKRYSDESTFLVLLGELAELREFFERICDSLTHQLESSPAEPVTSTLTA